MLYNKLRANAVHSVLVDGNSELAGKFYDGHVILHVSERQFNDFSCIVLSVNPNISSMLESQLRLNGYSGELII